MRRAGLGALALAPVLTLAMATAAAAEWRDHYRRGSEAFTAGRWAEVVREMNAALAERAEERAGTGLLARRYTPRYYLAVALAEQGDCRTAMPVFAEGERLGQIQRTPDWEDFRRRKETCESLLTRLARAVRRAEAALADADAAAAEVPALRTAPTLRERWQRGEPSLADLEAQAARTLRRARERLAEGSRTESVGDVGAAAELAAQATAAYRDVVSEARAAAAEVERATASALDTAESTAERARRALRGIRDLQPFPTVLGQRVAAVEAALERLETTKEEAGPADLQALDDELRGALERLGRAARRPPEALQDAVEAYLAGDYRGVVAALDGARFGERRARAQACLLRAAAGHALRTLDLSAAPSAAGSQQEEPGQAPDDGAADPAGVVLDRALEACRALDDLPDPDPRYFSPAFIRFFVQAMAVPAAEDDGNPP